MIIFHRSIHWYWVSIDLYYTCVDKFRNSSCLIATFISFF